MDPKRFFYVCGGVLLLMLAYSVGARNAVAQDPPGYILGLGGSGNPFFALRSDGTVWYKFVGDDNGWQQAGPPFEPVPFPIEGAIYGPTGYVMTQDGHLWHPSCGIGSCWTQDPDFVPPPTSVGVTRTSMSTLKAKWLERVRSR